MSSVERAISQVLDGLDEADRVLALALGAVRHPLDTRDLDLLQKALAGAHLPTGDASMTTIADRGLVQVTHQSVSGRSRRPRRVVSVHPSVRAELRSRLESDAELHATMHRALSVFFLGRAEAPPSRTTRSEAEGLRVEAANHAAQAGLPQRAEEIIGFGGGDARRERSPAEELDALRELFPDGDLERLPIAGDPAVVLSRAGDLQQRLGWPLLALRLLYRSEEYAVESPMDLLAVRARTAAALDAGDLETAKIAAEVLWANAAEPGDVDRALARAATAAVAALQAGDEYSIGQLTEARDAWSRATGGRALRAPSAIPEARLRLRRGDASLAAEIIRAGPAAGSPRSTWLALAAELLSGTKPSVELAARAVAEAAEEPEPVRLLEALEVRARVHLRADELDAACSDLATVISEAEERGFAVMAANARLVLADVLRARGEDAGAAAEAQYVEALASERGWTVLRDAAAVRATEAESPTGHAPTTQEGLLHDAAVRRRIAPYLLAEASPADLAPVSQLTSSGSRKGAARRARTSGGMAVMDERTLTARLKSWIDTELQATPYGRLTRAENEVHVEGSRRRHDLLIYAGTRPVFSCEVKVPTSTQGASPYDGTVVEDARSKADAEGLEYFGTLNCASFVLWQVHMPGVAVQNRALDRWPVVEPQHLTRLDSPEAERAFKEFLRRLLAIVAATEAGAPPTGGAQRQPEDELVSRIEGGLETIVGLTLPDVSSRFVTDEAFRRDVKRWMITDQGWQWDDRLRDELLLNTTKVACYLQMNRVLFYSTMRARFAELPELDLSTARSGRGVKQRLEPRFTQAMTVSRDYETIFDVGYITEVAYAGDAATTAWRGLVHGIEGVDLSGVGLDVLGGIFERLLSPEERHRFGQHYTNPQLVDLLVGASIRSRDDVVLDPASGGGTFLVRAYERLRQLGEEDHLVLLSQLYGNDLSRFAGHLSTVNLAARQIAREKNYPRIGTHDFFELDPGDELTSLPLGPGTPPERTPVTLPERVDVVIGNPPYVRRQALEERQKRRAEQAVAKYAVEANRPTFRLDGLSDLHVYFWPQATRLLSEGGHLALLTSSAWLQTRYGRQLKQLLLSEYDVVFVAETNAEPWFSDARVKTVATVARKRTRNAEVAPDHRVFFCQFRRPLLDLLGPPTALNRWGRVEGLIADMKQEQTTDDLRVRSVLQRELDADADWSPPLRAPDIYEHFVGLPGVRAICSEVANASDPYVLTVGPKFGSSWFVVQDVTEGISDLELADWGVTRPQVSGSSPRYRIVAGQDWRGPVETRYLQRWVRGPGDEPTRTLTRDAGDLAITIPRSPPLPRSAKVREYIRRGEERGEDRRVYTGQRGDLWYSVEDMERGSIIFPYSMQYGHKVWANPGERKRTTSPSAYLTPRGAKPEVALALLNSTWTFLSALFDAAGVGTEGLVRFGGRGQWRRLHVVDPVRATPQQAADLVDLWARIARREVAAFPPQGDEPLTGARRELDELTLAVAGVDDPVEASELVDALYEWLPRFTRERAGVEEMAVAGRQARGPTARIRNIVEQVVHGMDVEPPWIDRIDGLWTVIDLPDDAPDTSGQGSLLGFDGHIEEPTDVRFGNEWVRFDAQAQADYIRALAGARMAPRRVAIPPVEAAPETARAAGEFIHAKQHELRDLLRERIDDRDPSFADAFVRALSHFAAAVRTALHAS